MIGHQHIGVQRGVELGERLAQPEQITALVFLAEEARFAIMAALHDVQRDAIEVDAWAAGHVGILTQ